MLQQDEVEVIVALNQRRHAVAVEALSLYFQIQGMTWAKVVAADHPADNQFRRNREIAQILLSRIEWQELQLLTDEERGVAHHAFSLYADVRNPEIAHLYALWGRPSVVDIEASMIAKELVEKVRPANAFEL